MPPLDYDWRLRLAAFDALRAMREARGGVVHLDELERGFVFEGERIPLINARRGIWRPRQLGADGAAISVVTTPPKRGKAPPYDDQVGSDDGWFVYRYEGEDPGPRALRRGDGGARRSDGLLRSHGARLRTGAPRDWRPERPCRSTRDLAFYLEADVAASRAVLSEEEFVGGAPRRAYATTTVKARLHHPELLDAAHVLPDRDERGRPEVPNGLSLCKIHHSAFDADILGVDADYRIHIRRDVLEEHDGPMLLHGLQEMDRRRIVLPSREALRPNRDYLEGRFARFRAA